MGDQNLLGWSEGGGKIFSKGKKGGGPNFLLHVKGGAEKIDDSRSQTDGLPVKNDSSLSDRVLTEVRID